MSDATNEPSTPPQDASAELAAMADCSQALDQLDPSARSRALSWLIDRYGMKSAGPPQRTATAAQGDGHAASQAADHEAPSPKEFVTAKKPKTDVERITVLAYYLTHYRGVPHFATAQLSGLNTEAAQPRFSNAANSASNAVKSSNFLAPAPQGKRQITALGEAVVEALPDREAVKVAIDENGRRRRRPNRQKQKAPDDK